MDDLLLELQVWSWDLRDGKDLGVVKISKWWNAASGWKDLLDGLWEGWMWRRPQDGLWEL